MKPVNNNERKVLQFLPNRGNKGRFKLMNSAEFEIATKEFVEISGLIEIFNDKNRIKVNFFHLIKKDNWFEYTEKIDYFIDLSLATQNLIVKAIKTGLITRWKIT